MHEILGVINNGLLCLAGYLWLTLAYETLFNRDGVPNIRTVPRMRQKIIGILKKDFETRAPPSYTILDLGSGSGQLTSRIARSIPRAHVIGVETRYTAYLRSKLRQRLFGPANLEYKRLDFMSYDTSDSDAVIMYLSVRTADQVGKKLRKELKPGTLVASNMFALGGGWEPVDTIKLRALYQTVLFVYRQSQT